MLRRTVTLVILLLLTGCSASSDSGDVSFEHLFNMPTGTSVWTATGEAIDTDLLCPTATGTLDGFEDESGTARTPEQVGALHEAGEPFTSVSVESMTCDDGSGTFTLRFINEVDPAIGDAEPITAVTWTITGASGYDDTSGEGDGELPQLSGDTFIYSGTGTVTNG